MGGRMRLGWALPLVDVGGEPDIVRDVAQAAEAAGYDYLAAPDHVLGVNVESRPDWGPRNTSADLFHDPFVLFGFLAGVTKAVHFSTEVLILPQRQTALVAKQAACLDVLSGARFRLGVGVGWNPVEFVGLNEDFHTRGRRSAEQAEVMQRLWAEPHVSFEGKWHHVDDAGINPLPAARRVPLWFGGHEDVTLRRIARYGDGWIMNAHPPGDGAIAAFDTLRRYFSEAGRDPAGLGLAVWTSAGSGTPDEWRREVAFWKGAGATDITFTPTFNRRHHKRIAGRTIEDHLAAMRGYREAVAEAL